jgi:hypothetical protein
MNCSRCNRTNLAEGDFYKTSSGYVFSYCKVCHNKRSAENRKISRKKPENKLKDSKKKKLFRQNPEKRANVIANDSKSSDRKHNREYGLTLDKIRELISNPCIYCGETELQMTLDRINNEIGHIENNVVPACIRCNLIRKAMPYEAWICLVPKVREAKEKGLFEGWLGK